MDTLILGVLVLGAVIGFCQGAFKQIANFIGVALGIILASALYQQCGDYLAQLSGANVSVGHTVAFIGIVILVPIALGWIASLLTKAASVVYLGFLNRLMGAVLGAASYMLVLSFAFNVMDFLDSQYGYKPEQLDERSELYYLAKHVCQPIVPDVLIVTDSTEVAGGATPKCGIKDVVNDAMEGTVNETLKNILNTNSGEKQ